MHTIAGSVIDGVFRAALLARVSGNQTRRAVNEEDDELIEIPDDDPPLADVPKTGDMILPFVGMAIASGTAAIFVGKSVKKKDDEE